MAPHTITEHIEGTGHSGKKRSLVKTISWRTIGTIDTIIITRVVTGSWAAGATVGGIELFSKMMLYYLHERGWSKVDWGLEDVDVDIDGLVTPVNTKN
jgi:uncharacterized membrane protein